ncbi:MAG: SemiSWEET transporter [Ignavibacteria bacterium]|jgi:MtN3 and saliva related transmembrane protein|nr:SemiSWEET transporter [Ignavibacteria bacterium]
MDWTTAIGFFAAFITTAAYLPQSIKTIKTKHTKDLSFLMILFQVIGQSSWLTYGILRADIVIILANTLSLLLAAVILVYKIRFG